MSSEPMTDAVVVTEIGPGIAQITMQDRLGKNGFTAPLCMGLIQAFQAVREDSRWRVVVLTGYDNYFASGGTKDALLKLQEGNATFADVNLYSLALDTEIPVISAMQGHAIGGGFVMGLYADFVILGRESVYTTNFMRYGFTPGMGATYILGKKLGFSLAEEMLLAAENFRGAELAERGVPFRVLPRAEVLRHAHGLARNLAAKPRKSLIALKHHLVCRMREELPAVIEQELAMHALTFHELEVKERIASLYGR